MEITDAKNQIDEVNSLNEKFLANVEVNSVPQGVPAKLELSKKSIQVHAFGYTAEASPRVVRAEDGAFSVEYVFYVQLQQQRQEVFRFYLTSIGRLVESPVADHSSSICDFNNIYVAKHLCVKVMVGLLRSPLFYPLARRTD